MSQMSKQLTERFATVERAVLQGAAVAPRTGDGLDSASATVAVSHVPPPDLPFRCTTRAARMLSWPAIQAFVPPLFQVEGVSDLLEYPLCLEEHRGTASVTGDLPEWSGADSRLDFDPDKVWRYVHSYEMNIQNMHPLIPPLELYALVTAFLEALPAKTNPKRKRSSEPQGMPSPPWSGSGPASNNPSQAWPPSCSIQQALVLNILALGKICLHKQEAHTPSIELAGVDAGSDYFAAACSILGTLGGGRELTHVWALLLGGLYYGQLVQPIQSLEMVVQASRRLQIMLRPGMHHYMQLRNGGNTQQSRPQWQKRDNQCIVAFWTCVQLESDILETLPLPPSGILAYEQFMPPYPNGAVALEQGFGEGVLQSYTAQLFLRNQLNNFSTYAALDDDGDKGSDSSMRQLNAFSDTFQVHSWAPPLFLFRDGDPPAMDVLGARLRAKYWDAQAAMHQPFIQRILSFDGTAALAPNGLQQARRGIQAFIESTRAFHALPASAIITTNPFGLAHMQWVNLLVLDAVERDLVLGCYAPADLVDALFLRTIDVLDRLAPPSSSSALACDLRILKELHRSRLARSLCRTVGEQDFSV